MTVSVQVPTVRQGIRQFLESRESASAYLIPRWSSDFETQIICHPGESAEDDADDETIWTDGEQVWFNHRWPRNAWDEPFYRDRQLTFSLSEHAKAIGTTWWNWKTCRSVAVVFDVDAKEGHSDSTTTNTEQQLEQFVEAARSLPYTTIIRSKSGNGFHCYIFFDESDQPKTNNHKEHADLAGVVLDKMSRDAGFDFSKHVDVKGGNFWIWADEIGSNGFQLVQAASRLLTAAELGDWRAAVAAKAIPLVQHAVPQPSRDIEPLVSRLHRIKPKEGQKDGSRRLYACCCRGVGQDFNDTDIIAAVRKYEGTNPLPKSPTDAQIIKRIRDAENKVVRGSERVIRPGVEVHKDIEQLVSAIALDDATYQNSSNMLVRVDREPQPCKYALSDNRAPRIAPLHSSNMLELASRVIRWESWNSDAKRWERTRPDTSLLLPTFHRGHFPGVKVLHGIVSRPILLPSGEIVITPGYHADSGYLLDIDGEYPQLMSNQQAVKLLLGVIDDFPFVNDAYRSTWIAALLTLLVRNLIRGNTPFFPVDGNRSRVGKGLLTDLWVLIHQGRRASRYTVSDGDEMRKFLLSVALSGQDNIIFDNIKGRFGGVVLEAAMTAGNIIGRILGTNKEVDLPLNVLWGGTCNGMTYTRDMLGRTYPIMLETSDPHPENRTGFKIPNLEQYVREHRPELLIAGLSVVANFIRAGKPLPDTFVPLGGFIEWSNLIRGSIIHAGLPDPDSTRPEFAENFDDAVSSQTKELLKAWVFKEPTTVKQAIDSLDAVPLLKLLLDSRHEGTTANEYLGKLLRESRGIIVDGRFIDRSNSKVPKWSVVKKHEDSKNERNK